MQHHIRPAGAPPTNGYSHAVSVTGTLMLVSGQVPLDASGRLVGSDDAGEQTRQVFRNIAAVLADGGATMADVVKLTVFLTNMSDLSAFRAARDEFIDPERPPASSLVQVSGLVHPGFRVEIEAIAVLPA
ncbi:RidA family protein [Paractinoplanes toevensis]|uniref:Enamine deaminase RidA n=1 Tax=Paractinoplanes toevensis TaxID=571911 RepID=A0A919T912_9ACTN|nr:RidA family protein [Actinoplanes toevensis]GIM91230.1 enamine deaminase RidA [Actinoplanes toevensis]